ncbi:pyrroline-5-carboxylate reductase [Vibrio sp. SS-MA-C1-2]|uniref:pyrroline-5-carboxylate reductase n=1 Tax=Vibrio sp. SS-MA-C1-2 TaxID=2908646 RepID=UPI001F21116D|nr:pyrroline-5-carboxylate reductase [Vibrio sp. SS-MA-C1-2]UJF19065.1 pyrroline-5-carboxylate reductase [Vibrio sp. SS-MA-C1-2]
MEQRKIAFIGAGNMAKSIISGLVNSGYPSQLITTSSPNRANHPQLQQQFGINTTDDNHDAVLEADVVVLAVKPQMMADVCQPFANIDMRNKLIISIAAGVSCGRFNQLFKADLNLVRVMPNTPSLLGEGMSGLFATEKVNKADRLYTEDLLNAVGKSCWVEQESEINNIIAAAGSSPAYFFLFMEAMQKEAEKLGFDQQTARLLVQQSALGAAQMVIHNPDLEISTLRQQVTSKGGATHEAIEVFNQHQLSDTVAEAMQAAIVRAEQMEKLF